MGCRHGNLGRDTGASEKDTIGDINGGGEEAGRCPPSSSEMMRPSSPYELQYICRVHLQKSRTVLNLTWQHFPLLFFISNNISKIRHKQLLRKHGWGSENWSELRGGSLHNAPPSQPPLWSSLSMPLSELFHREAGWRGSPCMPHTSGAHQKGETVPHGRSGFCLLPPPSHPPQVLNNQKFHSGAPSIWANFPNSPIYGFGSGRALTL